MNSPFMSSAASSIYTSQQTESCDLTSLWGDSNALPSLWCHKEAGLDLDIESTFDGRTLVSSFPYYPSFNISMEDSEDEHPAAPNDIQKMGSEFRNLRYIPDAGPMIDISPNIGPHGLSGCGDTDGDEEMDLGPAPEETGVLTPSVAAVQRKHTERLQTLAGNINEWGHVAVGTQKLSDPRGESRHPSRHDVGLPAQANPRPEPRRAGKKRGRRSARVPLDRATPSLAPHPPLPRHDPHEAQAPPPRRVLKPRVGRQNIPVHHTEPLRFYCEVPGCTQWKGFGSPENRRRHVREVHEAEQAKRDLSHICPKCGAKRKGNSGERNFNYHVQNCPGPKVKGRSGEKMMHK